MVEISTGNLVSNNVSVANRNLLSGPYRNADGKEATYHIANSGSRRPGC